MEFLSPFVKSLKKHLSFLVYSTEYIEDMKKKMDQLNHMEKDVSENRSTQPHRKRKWLEDVKNLNERSNLIEEAKFFNVAKRYKLGKQSYGILEEIKDLEHRESKIEFTHAHRPLAEVGSTSRRSFTSAALPMGTQDNFESRDLVFKDALQALQSNKESQRMIALCGMGGVGKTTMMEQLKKVVEDSKMFDLVVKVVIGENNDPTSLQKAIAEYIGNKLDETIIDARADRLRKIFEMKSEHGQKKILVIMDDLWKEVELTHLGLSPLPNGFKLLFTSRFENVCTQMGVGNDSVFRVGVLRGTEPETLFFRTCHLDGDEDELQRIGEDIAKKCGGLPIAIVTIAKSLRGNKKEAWKEALSSLQHHDLQDLENIVQQVFELSYQNLRREDDKAIFLLCGLFPDDFNIPIEELMMYGWGLKLFAKVHTLKEARTRANICVTNLVRANLLTKSDRKGCVKMHDLVRAFILSNFTKVKQASIVNHDNMSWQRFTKDTFERILLKCTGFSGFPDDFNYQNLSLLMLMDGYAFFKLPEDVHKRMKTLKVLSYVNMGTPVLPVTLEHSTSLRTLSLRSCSLTSDISFIGSLSNLETLSLVDCNIRRLPSTIGKLKKLRLLNLTGCVDLDIDHGVFQNLDSLEELYLRSSKGMPVRFTDANCDEFEKLSQVLFALELEFFHNKIQLKNVSFKNLERFRISVGCELKNYEDYSFRNTLYLVCECTELKEGNIRDLFTKTEELRLQVKYMIHLKDVSLHHTFSQLRYLHVSKCAELQYLFTVDVANGLKKLEQLTISECPVLKTLIGENNGAGVVTLKKLNVMSLEDLPEMVSLCDNVLELPELVGLKLAGLPNFTSIYPDRHSNTSSMQPLFNKEGVLPKLEKLEICLMKNLKQIWPCEISTSEKNEVSMLRQIRVRECDSLINVFPRNPLPLLNHLEEVVLEKCGSIEVLFNIDFERVGQMVKHSSSRIRKIEVDKLKKLKELWRIKGVNESHTLVNGFKDVQTIYINDCDNFTDIFTPTTTNFDLGALTMYVTSVSLSHYEEKERKKKMIESDQKINATYTSYLLHTCPQLQDLRLISDGRVGEVVFDMDSQSSRWQLATVQPPLLLPHLEIIDLFGLKEMSHVWKCCNWNRFLIPQHQPLELPFQNLTTIHLQKCPKIKYLFSPLMAKYLSNLKSVDIWSCKGMEEVISSRYDENTTSTSSHPNTTFFPHFEELTLDDLPCLKCIDGHENNWSMSDKISSNISDTSHDHFQSGQVCWSLFPYPRSIIIRGCDALSSLVPWYAVGQMKRLQELKIENCSGMTEVFENELMNNNTNNNVDEGSGAATSLTSINSTTVVHVPQLSNLKTVCIYNCDLLPHIFTFSTLKTLGHLKELKVKRCKAMKVIIKEENEMPSEVVFPLLETLELDDLPNLKGFFLGMNDFLMRSLVNVMINDCDEWVMFTSGQLETPKIKYLHTSFGKHSIEHGFNFETTFPTSSDPTISKGTLSSFHNLIEINIQEQDVGTAIIPSNVLLQLEKLQQINIERCKGVKEVFEVVAVEGSGFNASQTAVQIPNLTQVELDELDDLKYLWKSNQWMVLEFPNLTTLSIGRCENLEHVFTCSMVGSLVQLQDLRIYNCYGIKTVLKEEECDAKVNEIVLPRLNYLHLHGLSSLKGFCLGKMALSLPALETLHISYCPVITVFTKGHVSTPELKVINTSFGKCDIRTDLNSFIETKQEEGHEF